MSTTTSSPAHDVIVVGGGIMGCSTAYHLKRADEELRVAIVERDPTYVRASTALSVGNVRVQFGLEENIRISLHTLEILDRFEDEMEVDGVAPQLGFRREGNLFLVEESRQAEAKAALARQRALGGAVEWWTRSQIRERLPLYRPTDYAGGSFGRLDGHLDGYAFLSAYRAKGREAGVELIVDEVTAIVTRGRRVLGVRLASGDVLRSGLVVCCAGAWAAPLLASAGVCVPVTPVRRQVFLVDCEVHPPQPLPLTCLPSGLYFRSEGEGRLLVGKSLPQDPREVDFTWDRHQFETLLWPELTRFAPAFDRLRLAGGWAGLYAVNTFDGNAILGKWPGLEGLHLAVGFSGHGLQQAPAVGRYLGEQITGTRLSLDLSVFDPERILEGRPLREDCLV